MASVPRKLPLHVLPAFEAATRLRSFRAAAEELHLTPSAVSHQIRLLEDILGVPLFRRRARGLELTDAGRSYAETVRESLGRLEAEADRLASAPKPRRLRVSLPDFVAHLHVLPALQRFRDRSPHVDLDISATMALADIESGDADAAVRIGMGQWGKLQSFRIADMLGTVVAAPELAERAASLSERGELPIVCLSTLEAHTRETLTSAGFRADTSRAICVDSYLGVVQAVEAGLGVAVLYAPAPNVYHRRSRLVALSDEPIRPPFAMYFVCRQSQAARPEIGALREWLVECIVSGIKWSPAVPHNAE